MKQDQNDIMLNTNNIDAYNCCTNVNVNCHR